MFWILFIVGLILAMCFDGFNDPIDEDSQEDLRVLFD